MKHETNFEIISRYKRSSLPIDLEAICGDLGIALIYKKLDKNIAGMIERNSDESYKITVNDSDSLYRQRFTIAHLIGHFVLHKDKIGDGMIEDRFY